MSFSTIAKISRLIAPKTNNKTKKEIKIYSPTLFFLKIIASNIYDAFGANHFTQFNIISAIYQEENALSYID